MAGGKTSEFLLLVEGRGAEPSSILGDRDAFGSAIAREYTRVLGRIVQRCVFSARSVRVQSDNYRQGVAANRGRVGVKILQGTNVSAVARHVDLMLNDGLYSEIAFASIWNARIKSSAKVRVDEIRAS
jgi:hypothetical protein